MQQEDIPTCGDSHIHTHICTGMQLIKFLDESKLAVDRFYWHQLVPTGGDLIGEKYSIADVVRWTSHLMCEVFGEKTSFHVNWSLILDQYITRLTSGLLKHLADT